MNRQTLFALLLPGVMLASPLYGQHVWFSEDFSLPPADSRWHAAQGVWTYSPGSVLIATSAYDQLLASGFSLNDAEPWSAEVVLRGARAGIFFGLEDTSSRALSHMVRFEEGSLLTGYFDAAGEFNATGAFPVPAPSAAWSTLRIDVDPLHGRYAVSVNGTLAGVDSALTFPSGHIGLQGSEGVSEFRYVRIVSAFPLRSPPPPRRGTTVRFHHVRFVRAG